MRFALKRNEIDNPCEGCWSKYEEEMWGVGLAYYGERIRDLKGENGFLIDLGCGPGQWSAAALQEGFKVIAYDKKLQGKVLSLRGKAGANLIRGSAECLPLKNGSMQGVLCELLLPYVNVAVCLGEICRVLKPFGRVHGICHGAGYYLMQAVTEGKTWDLKGLRRRGIVLVYTVLHHLFGFERYFYETFQKMGEIRETIGRNHMEIIYIRKGGHPVIRRDKYWGLVTFFEFVASKTGYK